MWTLLAHRYTTLKKKIIDEIEKTDAKKKQLSCNTFASPFLMIEKKNWVSEKMLDLMPYWRVKFKSTGKHFDEK